MESAFLVPFPLTDMDILDKLDVLDVLDEEDELDRLEKWGEGAGGCQKKV
jgi:hypothetical protein